MAPQPGQNMTRSGEIFVSLWMSHNIRAFRVEDEDQGYLLHISGYSGTARDSLAYHNGMKFSTWDRDNDETSSEHCAQTYKGGWWYKRYLIYEMITNISEITNCQALAINP